MYDTIVVGGGINGLLTAALLSNSGEKVLLAEKTSVLGGRCRVVEKADFHLDFGIHLIRGGRKSVFAKIFRTLGDNLHFREMGTSYVLDPNGKILLFPSGPGGVFKSRLFTFSDRLKLLKMLLSLRSGRYPVNPDENLDELFIREKIRNGSGVARYFRLLGASLMVSPVPERISSGAMLDCIADILKLGVSASYPEEGWQRILEILKSKVLQNGDLHTNTKVQEVVAVNGAVQGVKAGGTEFSAPRVVLALPPDGAASLIGQLENSDRAFSGSIASIVPTAGVSIDYALKKKVSDTSGLWFLPEPLSFGLFTSNLSPVLAPDGCQLYTHFCPLDGRHSISEDESRRILKGVEESLFKLFPGMENAVQFRRVMKLNLVDGTVVSPDQTQEKRPCLKVAGVDGLFIVGDYTGAEGAGGDIGYHSVWNFAEQAGIV